MPLKKFTIQPGNEIRGFKIRLYPTKEQELLLKSLEDDCRTAWNWLVNMTGYDSKNDVSQARDAYAIKQGLVPPKPEQPNYNGLTPEQSKTAKEAHKEACFAWKKLVFEKTKDIPGCRPRKLKELMEYFGVKQSYQLLQKVIGWKYDGVENDDRKIRPIAHIFEALIRNYFTNGGDKQRCNKFRRTKDPMPLQVKSEDCFKLGNFGARRSNENYYDCQIAINGLKIKGRLPGKKPEGIRILQGVSLIKEADGWWASVRQEVPIRILPPAIPGSVIGIDVGLDNIAAFSDGRIIANPRDKVYADKIAKLQSEGKPVGRLHLAAKRNVRHIIYNQIVKPLATVETIKIESLVGNIGQIAGSRNVSVMRAVAKVVKERYTDRVQEKEPSFTSQDCSNCKYRCKEAWDYKNGEYGECPKCGYKEHRDVNAAKNIAVK